MRNGQCFYGKLASHHFATKLCGSKMNQPHTIPPIAASRPFVLVPLRSAIGGSGLFSSSYGGGFSAVKEDKIQTPLRSPAAAAFLYLT